MSKTPWESYWKFIFQIGLSLDDFWQMTPKEFKSLIKNDGVNFVSKKDVLELHRVLSKDV